jgi:hypothetical protein
MEEESSPGPSVNVEGQNVPPDVEHSRLLEQFAESGGAGCAEAERARRSSRRDAGARVDTRPGGPTTTTLDNHPARQGIGCGAANDNGAAYHKRSYVAVRLLRVPTKAAGQGRCLHEVVRCRTLLHQGA